MEDRLYKVGLIWRFVGMSLAGPAVKETTILNFHRLLEKPDLG